MVRHRYGFLKRSVILEVCGDAGRPERVIPDLRLNIGRLCATSHHLERVPLGEGRNAQSLGPAYDRPEQRPFMIVAKIAAVEIGGQVRFQIVVTGRSWRLQPFS